MTHLIHVYKTSTYKNILQLFQYKIIRIKIRHVVITFTMLLIPISIIYTITQHTIDANNGSQERNDTTFGSMLTRSLIF